MSELIHIALAFDEPYALHGSATIASIVDSAAPDERLFIHVLDNGISLACRQRLQKHVESGNGQIQFTKLDLQRFACFPTTHHAAAAYSRLALPELLPELNRVIYLDSDVIVLKSLRPLWETELDERAAEVVRDAADVFGSHFIDHKRRLGLAPEEPAFNSGVMLMNLTLWRKTALASAVASWIRENSRLMCHSDQDALNAVLKGQVHFLNPIWNVQTPLIRAVRYGWIKDPEWIEAARNPGIIHYTTGDKPWKFSCSVPRRKDYRRAAKSVSGPERLKLPSAKALFQRTRAEAVEFKWWLAALLKCRLCSI